MMSSIAKVLSNVAVPEVVLALYSLIYFSNSAMQVYVLRISSPGTTKLTSLWLLLDDLSAL